uniref:exodeoxyribonuclease III n=1 Tax=Oreochromis aureus TaxID=47969 RepID=A0A668SST9_OREAU
MTQKTRFTLVNFKIASWNVKGLNNGIKRKKILTYLKLSRVDIAFIQEKHLCKSEALKLKRSWVGKVFSSPGTGKSRGVSALIHKAVSFTETKVITDKEGRFVLVYGQLLDTPIILCNIYAPNADIPAFFHNLSQHLLELEGAQIVVGGDFNQILDQDLDRSLPRRGTESKSVVAIRQMTSDLGLNDIWRTMHPEGREYSFYSPPHNVYTRIDYFLISEALVNNSVDSSIGNIVISDHAPIFLCLGNILQIPQSRRWRLNVSLIKDSGFIKLIRDEIQFYKQTNNREDTTLATWWDAMKAYLRGRIISYASFKKKAANKNIITLEAKLKALEAVHSHTKDRVTLNKIVKVKYKLNVLYNRKAEYALFCINQAYWEIGEKQSRLLAYRLKQKDSMNHIPGIRQSDGVISTSIRHINDGFRAFYNNLYSTQGTKIIH